LPEGYEKSVGWKDIEILNSEEGAPVVVLHGKAKKILTAAGISGVRVSISHTRKMAAANSVVV
jgi:phosphopantetheine--protein transferase-like protein